MIENSYRTRSTHGQLSGHTDSSWWTQGMLCCFLDTTWRSQYIFPVQIKEQLFRLCLLKCYYELKPKPHFQPHFHFDKVKQYMTFLNFAIRTDCCPKIGLPLFQLLFFYFSVDINQRFQMCLSWTNSDSAKQRLPVYLKWKSNLGRTP